MHLLRCPMCRKCESSPPSTPPASYVTDCLLSLSALKPGPFRVRSRYRLDVLLLAWLATRNSGWLYVGVPGSGHEWVVFWTGMCAVRGLSSDML